MSREQFQTFWQNWAKTKEGKAHLAKLRASRARYGFPIRKDGSFRVEDVPAGNYSLTVDVFELNRGPSWGMGLRVGRATHKLTVPNMPGGAGTKVLSIGELRLPRSAR